MKNIIKYIFPLIVAGSMTLGGCLNENKLPLPITQKTEKIKLEKEKEKKIRNDSLLNEVEVYRTNARNIFNKGLQKGNLNESEVCEIYYSYKKASEICKENNFNNKLNLKDTRLEMEIRFIVEGYEWGEKNNGLETLSKMKGYDIEIWNPLENLTYPENIVRTAPWNDGMSHCYCSEEGKLEKGVK